MEVEVKKIEKSDKKRNSTSAGNDAPSKKRRTVFKYPQEDELIFKVKLTQPVKLEIQQNILPDFNSNKCGMIMSALEKSQVKIGPSSTELKQQKSEDRKKYRERPEVQKAIKAKQSDPKEIEKRKQYASKPEVKEKKALAAKEGRKVRAELKRVQPGLYEDLLKKVRSMPIKNEDSTISSSSSSSDETSSSEESE